MPAAETPQTPEGLPDLRTLLARLPAALDREAARGVEGVIQLELTGEGGGTHFLALGDGACSVGTGRHPTPSVTLTLSARDCAAVLTGAVKARALFDAGRLQVAGNIFLALMLRDLFPRDRLLS